jgi:hypothetical protein
VNRKESILIDGANSRILSNIVAVEEEGRLKSGILSNIVAVEEEGKLELKGHFSKAESLKEFRR